MSFRFAVRNDIMLELMCKAGEIEHGLFAGNDIRRLMLAAQSDEVSRMVERARPLADMNDQAKRTRNVASERQASRAPSLLVERPSTRTIVPKTALPVRGRLPACR